MAITTRSKEGSPSTINCPMLNSTNYTVWAIRMKILLKVHEVWEIIETETTEGEKTTSQLHWSFNPSLKHLYYRLANLRRQTLMAKFERLKMKDTDSIYDFTGKLSELSSKSASLGENIEETKIVKKFLRSLPWKKYIHIVDLLNWFWI